MAVMHKGLLNEEPFLVAGGIAMQREREEVEEVKENIHFFFALHWRLPRRCCIGFCIGLGWLKNPACVLKVRLNKP